MRPALKSTALLEAELIGAALRYAALADWFEARPISHAAPEREREAMEAFNRIEAELRTAGRTLLRRGGQRQLVLEQALRGTVFP